MITIKGRYTSADVMIDNVEAECIAQIQTFCNHPAFTNPIKIMSDCHAGKGSVIGTTMKMTRMVIPATIGVDIGCGMLAIAFPKVPIDFAQLDKDIRARVPLGFNTNSKARMSIEDDTNWSGLNDYARKFRINYLELTGEHIQPVVYSYEWFVSLCSKIKAKAGDVERALGSLGGGNHFIEIAESGDHYWLIIHSGSRNFGLKVANYYQNLAEKRVKECQDAYYAGRLDGLKERYSGQELGDKIDELHVECAMGIPRDLAYLTGQDAHDYLHAMIFAQNYAQWNRSIMGDRILAVIPGAKPDEQITSVHNAIDFHDLTIRKGAIRSYEDEAMIIPFNMRDGSLIGTGKSNKDWNCSAPHGAGRVMSRTQAKKVLDLNDFKATMGGIYTTSVSRDTLDEAPDAYKPWTVIRDSIDPTMEVRALLKPVYNLKSGGDRS